MTVNNTKTDVLIKKVAEELKKIPEIKAPEWALFVKTGHHKERPPVEKDWWFARSASILRKVYLLGPIGTNKLKVKYGGKKNRGHKPGKTYQGSGNIIRKILQQLEAAELIAQKDVNGHKGRKLTAKGKKFLNSLSDGGRKPKTDGGATKAPATDKAT
ncbi:MAG: 30S ribosomal protein S19e [Nanoarchaeota archaeon]|nr:30S ribosomal protein S19e [Nanoarchaeota archaeon]MBU1445548.1 30S ribosomal protein S19e [Nanoarchaeota archaeon]MBU2406984.1 30S ribosomal protein S19e [Nanoarchaeota archaeon]MBU2420327.1 30S ribosomal protein S19e [Nanoarchaeota archaeon]MBU2475213.1 30S ribosomal protein S19e [Nanoarchaeota archaeon]